MRPLLPKPLLILLLVGPWAAAAGAQPQTFTAQPAAEPEVDGRETVRPVESPSAAAPAAAAAQTRCKLRVRSLQSRSSRRFSATAILDLDFHVRLRPAPAGEQTVRVEVETPSGHLFQTLPLPFTSEPARAGARRVVDGFPRQVEVQLARPVIEKGGREASVVVGRLPVAGTPIVHSSLYGKWLARAYVDDEIEPCGRARAFIIDP